MTSYKSERFPVVSGEALRIAFHPKAIRKMFPGTRAVNDMDDHDLLEVGREALDDDEVVESVRNALVRAICRLHPGVEPFELE